MSKKHAETATARSIEVQSAWEAHTHRTPCKAIKLTRSPSFNQVFNSLKPGPLSGAHKSVCVHSPHRAPSRTVVPGRPAGRPVGPSRASSRANSFALVNGNAYRNSNHDHKYIRACVYRAYTHVTSSACFSDPLAHAIACDAIYVQL